MITSGAISSQSVLIVPAPELSMMAPPLGRPVVGVRDEKGDPIANYAMVNESNAVWVNETGAQMVAQ